MLTLGCADVDSEAPGSMAESAPKGVFGHAPPAVSGIPSVVTLDGSAAVAGPSAPPPVLDQLGLAFSPRELVVRVGQPMTIENSEQLAHNVTIRTAEGDSTVLNTDTDPGQRFEVSFDSPGGYHVSCSVHPGMTAFIFATAAPYVTVGEPGGDFVLGVVPPGSYTLSVWSADPELRTTREVEIGAGPTELTLTPPR